MRLSASALLMAACIFQFASAVPTDKIVTISHTGGGINGPPTGILLQGKTLTKDAQSFVLMAFKTALEKGYQGEHSELKSTKWSDKDRGLLLTLTPEPSDKYLEQIVLDSKSKVPEFAYEKSGFSA